MSDNPIFNRAKRPANSGEPKGPFGEIWKGLSALARRVLALEKAEPARDGTGIAGAMIDRDGVLVLTLTNGAVLSVGTVVGTSISTGEVAALVKAEVEKAVSAIPPAEPGKSVTLADVAPMIDKAVADAVAALPEPVPGKDADPAETAALVKAEVERAVAALPPAEPGKSVTLADVAPMIDKAVADAVAALPEPVPGKDADPAETAALVKAEVEKAVEAIDLPHGIDAIDVSKVAADTMVLTFAIGSVEHSFEVSLPEGAPGKEIDTAVIDAAVDAAVAKLPKPADGVSIIDMIVDADGHLNIVLSDARRVNAGKIVPDAQPGPAGRSVASARISDEGHLILAMTDGEELDAGHVEGKPGDSVQGDPGRGIAALRRDGDDLVVVMSDDEVINLGRIKGAPGKRGETVKGDPGATLELINFLPADLTASDIERLSFADLTLGDGTAIRVLTSN